MDLFYFDIETVGKYKNFEEFEGNDSMGSNIFRQKSEKLNWIEEFGDINEAYLNKSGIISTYGKIVCISCGYLKSGKIITKSFYGDDEKEIVNKFNETLKSIQKKNFNLCGYNITAFDIPWLLHKLHKYEIEPASIIYTYNKKPWEMRITDLFRDWKGVYNWYYSLEEVCYELEIDSPKDKISGNDVHKTYWNGDIQDIVEYCEKDIESYSRISKKIY